MKIKEIIKFLDSLILPTIGIFVIFAFIVIITEVDFSNESQRDKKPGTPHIDGILRDFNNIEDSQRKKLEIEFRRLLK